MERLLDIASGFWSVLIEMAPYLLFGFAAAAAMAALMPQRWVERHLGGRGLAPVLKASALGVPLPLCSCSVIPVSASLRRAGAGKGPTLSFLISTPQTGVDSILVTYGLLGGAFAIFRPILALVSGLAGGMAVSLLPETEGTRDQADRHAAPQAADAGKGRLRRALEHGFVTLPGDIGKAVLVGLLIAALISALLPPGSVARVVPPGIAQVAVMMAIGIPIYVCATASVPIAAALIAAGVTPGAALAFLVTGAATNAATIAMIWKVMGRRTTAIYLLTMAASALLGGLLLDQIVAPAAVAHHHGTHWMPMWVKWASAAVLLAVLGSGVVRPYLRRRPAPAGPQRLALNVAGMTCSHCAKTVEQALSACAGVSAARVDLHAGRATVSGDHLDPDALSLAVSNAGYQATPADDEEDDRDKPTQPDAACRQGDGHCQAG